jgi:signal transduction histidine kinase
MNIKIRLALQFTLIVAAILLFFAALAYYFSYSSQVSKFRQNLLESAKNTATLMIEVDEIDSSLLEKIHRSTIPFNKEELALTDSAFNITYSYNVLYLADRGTRINYARGPIKYFSVSGKDGVFYRYIHKNRKYYVYAMAYDYSRNVNLTELRKILLWSIIFSVCLSVVLAYFFAKRAIRPISRINKSIKEINSSRLSNRLDEGNRKDEIRQLSLSFNEMLSDLEIAFKNQEDFVQNASHELRTPLTVMIGESDYFLSHDKKKEEYIEHISGLIIDLKNLNSLINSLLELARINRDKNITLSGIHIDEIVFTAIHQVKEKYNQRKIVPRIQYPENGSELIVEGNTGLLEIAFKNLIENACKFSEGDVGVEFLIDDDYVKIFISDTGIGIPDDEIESISRPFKRASNVKFIGGFGIGLSLVARIMELHNADLKITSKVNEGSLFELTFKRTTLNIGE